MSTPPSPPSDPPSGAAPGGPPAASSAPSDKGGGGFFAYLLLFLVLVGAGYLLLQQHQVQQQLRARVAVLEEQLESSDAQTGGYVERLESIRGGIVYMREQIGLLEEKLSLIEALSSSGSAARSQGGDEELIDEIPWTGELAIEEPEPEEEPAGWAEALGFPESEAGFASPDTE